MQVLSAIVFFAISTTVAVLMVISGNLSRKRLQGFAMLCLVMAVLLALAHSNVVCVIAVLMAITIVTFAYIPVK